MALLGAVGLGAVWGWLLVMAWAAHPVRLTGIALLVVSAAPMVLALVNAGTWGLLAFLAATAGFAGTHLGWRRWLRRSSDRTNG